MSKLLISVLGHDQPGIIAAISEAILLKQGNVENVSQTLLQSVFGALIIVTVPENISPENLKEELLEKTKALALFIHVDKYTDKTQTSQTELTQPYIVTVLGADQKGLVFEVSKLLAKHRVNITNMQALFKGGDEPSDNLMIFEVDVPKSTVMSELRTALEKTSKSLALEINIQHQGIFEAVSRIQNI